VHRSKDSRAFELIVSVLLSFFVGLPVAVSIMGCIVDVHNHYRGFTM
jgi:hypothetical protein